MDIGLGTVKEGDTVVLFRSRTNFRVVTVKAGEVCHNGQGLFPHDALIGLPLGGKAVSQREQGWMYVLPLTPALYAVVLTHRTQVLYQETIAPVLLELDVTPASVIVESGTGSGCLSAAFGARLKAGRDAPTGHLFTFEFHAQRKQLAEEDFARLGLGDVVTVVLRDAVRDGFLVDGALAAGSADCVFLDLPNVHEAVGHAHAVLKPGGRIACFCPCIEQTQKACDELRRDGRFTALETREYIFRPYVLRTHRAPGAGVLCCPCVSVKGHAGYLTFAMKAFPEPAPQMELTE